MGDYTKYWGKREALIDIYIYNQSFFDYMFEFKSLMKVIYLY